MLEIFFIHWKSFLKILLVTIISITIGIYVSIDYLRDYVLANWNYYRDKPYIIPFSGVIKKKKSQSVLQSTFSNLTEILWAIVKEFLLLLVKPFYPVLNILIKILDGIRSVLDNFRKQFKIMRNFLFRMVQNIYIRLQDSVASISIFFFRLRESLKRQIGLYKLLSWTIAHAQYFLYSMVSGPIGNMGKFAEKWGITMSGFTLGFPGIAMWFSTVCFDENTQIGLQNKQIIPIKDIKIGDVLVDNNIVEGVCVFDISQKFIPMFLYKNVIVSGDHIVQEDNKYIRVKDSRLSILTFYSKTKLYCLVTSNGIININDTIFNDYIDTHNPEINTKINLFIENFLNSTSIISNENECNDYLSGISNNNQITDINGKITELKNIKIGDKINGSTVNGIIHILNSSVTSYLYTYRNNSIILSGNQLIWENNRWIRAHKSKHTVKHLTHTDNFINFITDSGELNINNFKLRDFMETHSLMANKMVADIVDNHLIK